MTARRYIFSLMAWCGTMLCPAQEMAADSTSVSDTTTVESHGVMRYNHRVERYTRRWNSLVPNLSSLQFAGDIGMFSLGAGWDYGRRNQWETYVMLGYVPKHRTPDELWTLTVKEIYTPWTLHIAGRWHLCPLFATLWATTTLSGEFWVSEPARYPKGYYGFSSKVRFHIGVGQKIKISGLQRRSHWFKDMALYYEVSSCDLYIRQKFMSHSIPLGDIICLAIGVQYTIF